MKDKHRKVNEKERERERQIMTEMNQWRHVKGKEKPTQKWLFRKFDTGKGNR